MVHAFEFGIFQSASFFHLVYHFAIGESGLIVGIDLERAVESLDGFLVLPLHRVNHANAVGNVVVERVVGQQAS